MIMFVEKLGLSFNIVVYWELIQVEHHVLEHGDSLVILLRIYKIFRSFYIYTDTHVNNNWY